MTARWKARGKGKGRASDFKNSGFTFTSSSVTSPFSS